jgi:hypothetical protein
MFADCLGPRCSELCKQLVEPYGLRFTADGTELAVANDSSVSLFHVEDGSFVQHVMLPGLGVGRDVEEYGGGWLVTSWETHTVDYVSDSGDGGGGGVGRPRLGSRGAGDGEFDCPSALALVPGLGPGLAVRETGNDGRLQFFASCDSIAMANMSPNRVAWMTGVARCAVARALAAKAKKSETGRSKRTRTRQALGH